MKIKYRPGGIRPKRRVLFLAKTLAKAQLSGPDSVFSAGVDAPATAIVGDRPEDGE